jgi:2-phospho-L-lactate guanylyltransferase
MTCWIVVPIKEPGACKTRLRSMLDDVEREHLVHTMLRHVMVTVSGVGGNNRFLLLSRDGYGVPPLFERIPDTGRGLNGELTGLAKAALGADRLVIVPADLPLIGISDVNALIGLPPGLAAIAPDRAQLGTNALSLPLPMACDFRFQFGVGSFARHSAEAARLSLPLSVLHSDRLAFDIDEPADLADLWAQHPGLYCARSRYLETGGGVG